MKKIHVFISVIILIFSNVFAQESKITLPLSEVKVYLQGAELTHIGDISLKKGINQIVIEKLADEIEPNSITVSSDNNQMVLVSVTQKTDFLSTEENPIEIKKLEDSLESLNYQSSQILNEINVLDTEYDFITSNKIISGKDKTITVIDLQETADFFYSRLLEIKNRKLKIFKENEQMNKTIARIRNQLQENSQQRNKTINQIVLNISTEKKMTVKLALKYFIQKAGWQPFYDIRVKDVNSEVAFFLKANVMQQSGLDWNDVDLTISTRNPSKNGVMPVISSIFLNFVNEQAMQNYTGNRILNDSNGFNIRGGRATESQIRVDGLDIGNVDLESIPGGYAVPQQNTFSVDYHASVKYTIPSDSKLYKVDLEERNAPAIYEYYSAPKLRPEAFLVAKISNMDTRNLLSALANVYYENSFVGQTYINPDITTDSMLLSLGSDKNVIVTRDIMKDFTENKFLSSDIERHFGYKMTIRNTKKEAIKLTLEDVIPLSKNENIEIKMLENPDGAAYDKETGKLKWNITIEPNKSIEKRFQYSVRHPRNKKVIIN